MNLANRIGAREYHFNIVNPLSANPLKHTQTNLSAICQLMGKLLTRDWLTSNKLF